MKTNWVFAGAVTCVLAVIVPVINNGMLTIADELHRVGSVLHRAEFQHVSQVWASPFRNLPFPLVVYMSSMLALGAVMVAIGLTGLRRTQNKTGGR